jgi:hypothetical protein
LGSEVIVDVQMHTRCGVAGARSRERE